MVDTLGLPTIFFTHSAADLQWPKLALSPAPMILTPEQAVPKLSLRIHLSQTGSSTNESWNSSRPTISEYLVSPTTGCGLNGGLAWLPNAPDVEQLLSSPDTTDTVKAEITRYADGIVSTCNPAVLPDGSNLDDAPAPKTDPHVCNQQYGNIQDFDKDLSDLVATCQRHTRCSATYCLRTRNGRQECRFGYPKPLQPHTAIVLEDEPTLLTTRNDGMVNSFNPVQLSAWRANVDMQYIVSRRRVIEYCTKYVTKSEPRSQSLKEVFTTIVRSLKEGNNSLKAVQKLLINSVGERDYSAQETCHLILQVPMFKASRDFIVLSLDGSRAVEDRLEEEQRATAPSILDHYMHRPNSSQFNDMTLLEFARQYSMPKTMGSEPTRRSKRVIIILRPYCSPDPAGPQYEQYCRQSLMQHKRFRQFGDLADSESYVDAYAAFLQSGLVPPCLEDDIHRLQQQQQVSEEPSHTEVYTCMYIYKYTCIYASLVVPACTYCSTSNTYRNKTTTSIPAHHHDL